MKKYTRERFFIRRKSGYLSPYSLRAFYGSWRAGIYFGNNPAPVPMIRFRNDYHEIPTWIMWIFRPFNRYTETMKGERFI